MKRSDFTYRTDCKGETFTDLKGYTRKIRNKSIYCVFYKGDFIGIVDTKTAAEKFISNLIKYNKLEYTQEYRLGEKLVTAEEYRKAKGWS